MGCVDFTLMDAAASFNVFANGGVFVKPYMISWIKDEYGNKLYKHQENKHKAIDPLIANQVSKVLSINMERLKKINPEKMD